jgi:hypothetical protein
VRYIKFLIPALAVFLASCDEIEEGERIIDNSCEECSVSGDDIFVEQKNAFIEEFTGHTCNNCPTANAEAKKISDENPGRVILLGVHASNFAIPNPAEGYFADFRTEIGTDYFNFVNPFGVPSGLVDRLDQGTQTFAKPYLFWNTVVEDVLDAGTADIGVSVQDIQFNAANGSLTVEPKFKVINELSDRRVFWTAFIAENKIKAPQKLPDNSKDTSYVHNHVLRGSFNGLWGQPIPDFTGVPGDVSCCAKTINVENEWVPENLEIIVIAYDRDTYEVFQTVSVQVLP